jgi:DNA-binding MarR family transcriptional regulator
MPKKQIAGSQSGRGLPRRPFTGLSWQPPSKVGPLVLRAPEDFLPYQAFVLSAYFSHELQKLYAECGLTLNEWRVLLSVAGGAADTAIDIVYRVHLDEVAVHRAIKLLISRGLVKRKNDGKDRRRKPLVVTAKGLAVYEEIMPRAQGFEQWVLNNLALKDRKALARIMKTLFHRLGLAKPRHGAES